MQPWEILGKERAPDGGELVLSRRGDELRITVGGKDLMSSRQHGSEEELARLGCDKLRARPGARVLIGGLGMGYTLRAALDAVGPDATVTVAELVPAVVAWNRGPLAHLAGHPLDDPRARVAEGDVLRLLEKATERFDAILLDVDNGPSAMTRKGNQAIYGDPGLAVMKRCLRAGGVLAIWSAYADPAFEKRMRKAGFAAESVTARARGQAGGTKHAIFVGRL